MLAHLSITLLLAVTLTGASAGRTLAVKGGPPAVQEKELTPEEKREALELAARFGERLLETNDFRQVVDELFVLDFPDRLWQSPHNSLPWYFLDKSLMASAGRDELLRYYVSSMNFFWLVYRLYEAQKQLKGGLGEDESELKFEEVVSTEVVKVLLANPTLAKFVEQNREEERGAENAKENGSLRPLEGGDSAQAAGAAGGADAGQKEEDKEEDEAGIIKTLAQLNDISAAQEKAAGLMRRRLANMPHVKRAALADEGGKGERQEQDVTLTSMDEDSFGYPEGTPKIHLDVMPFCLDVIRAGGRLKILSASLYTD